MLFTCNCCGIEVDIDDEAQFDAFDWERVPPTPEQVKEAETKGEEPLGQIYCNLCPAFYCSEMSLKDHSSVHDMWESFGRPDKFSIDDCLLVEDRDKMKHLEELASKIFDESHTISEKRLASSTLHSIHFNDHDVEKMLNLWAKSPMNESIW